jgi:hypothetical protein
LLQNTGLLATYLSGRFPRLVGMPRREFSQGNSVIRRFAISGIAVAGGVVSKEAFSAFGSAYASHDAQPNVVTRNAMDAAIGAMCLDVMSPLATVAMENDFALATTGQPLVAPDEIPVGSRDIAMVLGMIDDQPTIDDIVRMAHAVASKVARRLHGKEFRTKGGPRPFVADASVMDMLTALAQQKIEEYT